MKKGNIIEKKNIKMCVHFHPQSDTLVVDLSKSVLHWMVGARLSAEKGAESCALYPGMCKLLWEKLCQWQKEPIKKCGQESKQ